MYLNDYVCSEDRNLGDAEPFWEEVTYLPTSGTAGQDTYHSPPTYFDPSYNRDWLSAIGFKGDPMAGRREIPRETVFYGGGESGGGYAPGPLPDGWLYQEGQGVDPGSAVALWTPVRQWERDNGLRQQVAWLGGSNRYARYVDRAGNQVGPVVQTYRESKFAKIIGDVVKVVAGAMVAVGAVQAVAAVAAGATAGSGATAAAAPAATAAPAAVAAPVAAIPAATAIPASVVAPAVGGASGMSAVAAALPSLSTVAKGVAVLAPIVKTQMDIKAKEDMAAAAAASLPIAPPANMLPAPNDGLLPAGSPQYSPRQPETPAWMIPALVGGIGLAAVMMMKKRRSR